MNLLYDIQEYYEVMSQFQQIMQILQKEYSIYKSEYIKKSFLDALKYYNKQVKKMEQQLSFETNAFKFKFFIINL